jgi:ABC-2 type transport system permease protein
MRERPAASVWRSNLRGVFVVAKKDAVLYYLRSPVLIFGVLFPVFFFLAFTIGRRMEPGAMLPGMLAVALFFTASAVGPLVTPWERRARTYERLVSCPISLFSIILGDVVAGALFGAVLSAVALALGLALTDADLARCGLLAAGLVLSAFCFAGLGALLSAPPTDNPSQVMMLSNLVRLPLIFVSGVFLPLREMPEWTRAVSTLSPLSYCADVLRAAFGDEPYFPLWVDMAALLGFTAAFLLAARFFHGRSKAKAL